MYNENKNFYLINVDFNNLMPKNIKSKYLKILKIILKYINVGVIFYTLLY